MGKAKKKSKTSQHARRAVNPLRATPRIGANRGVIDEEAQKSIPPLVQKLSSAEPEDRAMSIAAINSLIENVQYRKLLLKERLVPTVMKQNITDSSIEVSAEAYGLLRNLVIEEGYDIAMYLYRQDILTAIKSVLDSWSPKLQDQNVEQELAKVDKTMLFSLFENVIGLLTTMAMYNEEIYESIDKNISDLALFLIRLIPPCKKDASISEPLFAVVAQGLYILSEDNERVVSQIIDYPFEELLQDKSVPVVVKVCINGLKLHGYTVAASIDKEQQADSPLQILKSLVSLLKDADVQGAKNVLAQENSVNNDAPVDVKELNKASSHARLTLDSVQLSLEIFAAVAETIAVDTMFSQQPSDDNEQMEQDDDAIDTNDADMEDDATNVSTKDITKDPSSPAGFLLTEVLPLSFQLVSDSMFTLGAMSVINNSCWSISPLTDGEVSASWKECIEHIWSKLFSYANLEQYDIDVVNSALGALWVASKSSSEYLPIDIQTIDSLVSQAKNVKQKAPEDEDASTETVVRTVGLLSSVGSKEGHLEQTQRISNFLFEIVSHAASVPPKVLFETLNSIYDMFGDAEYDYDLPVFVNGGLNKLLSQAVPSVRQAIRKVDKNKDPNLRAIGEEAGMNLTRFIQYKNSERS